MVTEIRMSNFYLVWKWNHFICILKTNSERINCQARTIVTLFELYCDGFYGKLNLISRSLNDGFLTIPIQRLFCLQSNVLIYLHWNIISILHLYVFTFAIAVLTALSVQLHDALDKCSFTCYVRLYMSDCRNKLVKSLSSHADEIL